MKGDYVEHCYIAGDVESSCGSDLPPRNNLISFGLCVVGNPEEFWYSELRLLSPLYWDPKTEDIHRMTPEYLRHHGKDIRSELEAMTRWVRAVACDRDAVFCAMPVWFDYGHIDWYLRRFDVANPFAATLDGRAQYRELRGLPSSAKIERAAIYREFPPWQTRHTHHALSDAFEYEGVVAGMLRAQGIR